MRGGVWPDEQLLRLFSEHRTAWGTGFARTMMDAGTNTAVLAVGSRARSVCGGASRVSPSQRCDHCGTRFYCRGGGAQRVLRPSTATGRVRDRPPQRCLDALDTRNANSGRRGCCSRGGDVVHLPARLYWGGVLAGGTVVVGVCLVYLGVHWATDVLAGCALGAALGVGAGVLCRSGPWIARSPARA